jgi:murein DD-endopeptidase MepM/ murein hydrolase activator NlpD
LPKVTVGVRRAPARLRPDHVRAVSAATRLRQRSLAAARSAGVALTSIVPRHDRPAAPPAARPASALKHRDGAHPVSTLDRLGMAFQSGRGRRPIRPAGPPTPNRHRILNRERLLPASVAGLVLAASIASVAPAVGAGPSVAADPILPRFVVGGGVLGLPGGLPDGFPTVDDEIGTPGRQAESVAAQRNLAAELSGDEDVPIGPYLADGTLMKPIAVDTTIPDARERLTTYRVQAGDTLTGIANRFGLSMMTVWWANKLKAKDDLKVGQQLVIPPTDGLVVTVAAGDTLALIAAKTGGDAAEIRTYNELPDETVVVGQMLMIPGVRGAAIATPTPKPAAKPTSGRSSTSGSSGGGSTRGPTTYSGGSFAWPLPGHRITQYYHYGHYGIDIQGSYGDRVRAAAGGTVIWAGWRNNGGGYVVWVSHGSGLYTTYNHLSAVLVRRGAHVGKGQVVGRVGSSGWATGAHLHFEVWRGGVPGGTDRRVNPLRYY